LYYDQRTKPGKGIGSLNNSNSWSQSFITSNRLHYNNNFGKHYVNALAVAEAERNYSESNGAYGEGFVAGISVMDAAAKVLSGSGSKNETAFTKVLAQLDYNYDNRYFAIGSIINEASSLFGSNNRSANFFTLGGSWILSNENFMKNLTLFDLLKIRASYGSVGNANISNYQSLVLYALTTQYNNNPGSFPKQMGNPDLTWEKVKTADFAIEVGVLKRISLIVDMYSKKSSALLLNVQVPFTSGFEYSLKNIGAVRNKGLELTLSTFNLIGEFKWNTDFNIAFNRNKVLKLDDLGNDIILSRSQIVDGIISVGYDMNTWYLRKWLGVDPQTGDPLWEKVTTDENGNEVRTSTNVYSEATMQKIGGMSPKFTGGITNTFSYKRISLSVFFNFVQGNQILHRSRQTYDSDGFYDRTNAMVLADGWSRWQKPGDVATHPKPVMGGNKNAALLSTRYLENGSFIRMRNVSISYVLPTTFLQNLRISNARIFVSGDNLWTLTKFSGLDPEVIIGPIQGGGTTNYSSDMDYPISKKILFGLNVEF
jgi:TonB-linked SusC/RagA family outer membrane protein